MQNTFETSNKERGASMVEYAMLIAFISIVSVAAVGLLGGSVTEAFTGAADGMATQPAKEYVSAGIDGELQATFEVSGGKVALGTVDADGWTYKVTKDTGRRVVVKFTNSTSKKIVSVKGWLNKKDAFKTKVKVIRQGKT
ncbi:MAG: hypothetical protein BMS9Abin12_1972 [Acidimicrobiia bacterium]|nr:MAG: hypothetical protein BMS9Abin12_1972 [Acidimicrobiia bacterium]